MSAGVKGWHRGERAIQSRLNFGGPMSTAYNWIQGSMDGEDRAFHTSLPFIPITTLDNEERPWASILTGSNGRPGFIQSPTRNTFIVKSKVWDGDPLWETAATHGVVDRMLFAGLGLDFETRGRSKFAGWVSKLANDSGTFTLELTINQSLMNCPKYISIRELIPFPNTSPTVLYKELHLSKDDRLPKDVISFIHKSDITFLGTTYKATKAEEGEFPSHLGMNERGGRPGFIRVAPSDGRSVILPDYSGNRMMTSLGNIEASSLASLTFVDFETGDILYLTGEAENLSGADARRIMPLQNVLTSIYVTGYLFVKDALPIRRRPGSVVDPSPYNPPVRFLAEESEQTLTEQSSDNSATLTKIEIHSPSIATFTWETSKEVKVTPGQAAVLDFTSFLGPVRYQHMAQHKPSSINDDRIRTWTISSAHTSGATRSFSLTMKEKEGGTVTGALFNIMRKIADQKSELLSDTRKLGLNARLVGIVGTFSLPKRLLEPPEATERGLFLGVQQVINPGNVSSTTRGDADRFLWVAGGVGITPFLSMLSALANLPPHTPPDITIVLSTQEPDVLLPLIAGAIRKSVLSGNSFPLKLALSVFSHKPIPDFGLSTVEVHKHSGRIPREFFLESGLAKDREVFLCGPAPFEKAVIDGLEVAGVPDKSVRKESFDY